MDTIFYNAQHPGEGRDSAFPATRSTAPLRPHDDRPLSSVMAAAFDNPLGFDGAGAPTNIADYVKAMVAELNTDPEPPLTRPIGYCPGDMDGDYVLGVPDFSAFSTLAARSGQWASSQSENRDLTPCGRRSRI